MICLPHAELSQAALDVLAGYQAVLDAIPDYAERVAEAKKMFSNRTSNKTFDEVRAKLAEMCAGAQRCAYCEDSYGDEVEHIKPKDFYPDQTFAWDNYLYACGACNGRKNNRWAVFSDSTGNRVNIQKKDPPVPPEPGDPLFLNPRQEDPLPAVALDLVDSFYFAPSAEEGSQDHERADYTIEILCLNTRDALPAAREEAYENYVSRLSRYITLRDSGAPQEKLDKRIDALRRMAHPTVWVEIKRQRRWIPELQELFEQAPEALDW
jgi:uncharacterized protein (TIGR02646 family)